MFNNNIGMEKLIIGMIILLIILVIIYSTGSTEPCYDGFGNVIGSTKSGKCKEGLDIHPGVKCYGGKGFVEPVIIEGEWGCPVGSEHTEYICRGPDGTLGEIIEGECSEGTCIGNEGEKDVCYDTMETYRPASCGSDGMWGCDSGSKKLTYEYKGCSTAQMWDSLLPNQVYGSYDTEAHPGYFGYCLTKHNNAFKDGTGAYKYYTFNDQGRGCSGGDELLIEPNDNGICNMNGLGDPLGSNNQNLSIYELVGIE
jgi:hypothetical protein